MTPYSFYVHLKRLAAGSCWGLLSLARALIAYLLLGLAALPAAQAHLMVAQRGTLNIVGDGGFMVLSLPVSAFNGVDDDHDSKLSATELSAHRLNIISVIKQEMQLVNERGPLPLEGILLSLSPPDDAPAQPATQLVVMGRFVLAGAGEALRFKAGLFGKVAQEQSFQITVSRAAKTHTQLLVLTPDKPESALFHFGWSVFADFIVLGIEHIVSGLDHLIFLLVVLAGGMGWRQVVMTLTCFTLGHAVTLVISVFGGLAVSAAIVEPTIAATIIGMAGFDAYAQRNQRVLPIFLRLALVFGCALVHGLGFATALVELGLDSGYRLQSLAGFNLGIEIGQLGVAIGAALIATGIRWLRGETGINLVVRMSRVSAISIGAVWFMQRILYTMPV